MYTSFKNYDYYAERRKLSMHVILVSSSPMPTLGEASYASKSQFLARPPFPLASCFHSGYACHRLSRFISTMPSSMSSSASCMKSRKVPYSLLMITHAWIAKATYAAIFS